MRVNHRESDIENHDIGLDHDLPRLLHRRGLLSLLAGTSLIALAGCATDVVAPTASSTGPGVPPGRPRGGSDGGTSNREVSVGEVPEETAGPYPGNGSNGVNVLDDAGVVRSDITSSFGSSTSRAAGVPLSITMTVLDHDNNDAPLVGAAVYVWHCDREGRYSLYSDGVTRENYLRGVQETDTQGQVRFTSIYPACYSGRWPHIHFEVYRSLTAATSSENKIATSQIALTESTATAAYATSGYEQSLAKMRQVSLAGDNVFRDGYDLQMPAITGDATSGYALTFQCSV